MPDYQPIDYRLRCHTKRTDLPSDVLRDIGEAYAEIERLRRLLLAEENDSDIHRKLYDVAIAERESGKIEIERLRSELEDTKIQLANMEDDYFRIREHNEKEC